MNSLHFPSVQYSSATLLYNVSTPLFSPNRLKQLIKHNPPPQHSSPTLLCNTLFPTLLNSTRRQHPNFISRVYVAGHCKGSLKWSLDVFVLLRFAMYDLLQMCCREVLRRRRELLEKGAEDLPRFRRTGMRLHQILRLLRTKWHSATP